MAATLFAIGVTIITIGFLWFYVVRPILEDFGIIRVNDIEEAALDTMSSTASVPVLRQKQTEHRSYALEQLQEQPGTKGLEHVPGLVEQIESLSDDALLDILARVKDDSGEPRFAESRIGRFIGGRLEDRITQVREVRGVATPAKPTEYKTPIAGRPTKASYYPEQPELEYEAP